VVAWSAHGQFAADERGVVQLYRPAASGRLAQYGDPYTASVMDRDGRVGIDYGVYGVPETFVIDKGGTIRFKQIGPLTAEALEKKIMPLVRELQKAPLS